MEGGGGGGGGCASGMSSERTREPRRMSFLWTLNSTPSLESKITSASRELKGSAARVVEVEAILCEYASMVLDRGGAVHGQEAVTLPCGRNMYPGAAKGAA